MYSIHQEVWQSCFTEAGALEVIFCSRIFCGDLEPVKNEEGLQDCHAELSKFFVPSESIYLISPITGKPPHDLADDAGVSGH